jgi:hypothetical protein
MIPLFASLLVVAQSRGAAAVSTRPLTIEEAPVRHPWVNPLDRKLILVEGREFLLELRIDTVQVARLDETTQQPLLDESGQPVTRPTQRYRVFIITPGSTSENPGALVGEADLIRVHMVAGPEYLNAGGLGWDAKSKNLYLISSLAVDNSAYLQIHKGPLLLGDNGLLRWQPSDPLVGLHTIDGTGVSGVHPIEKIQAICSESTIDLALIRRGMDGVCTRASYSPATKKWLIDGYESRR